jgi:hypothetical protein
MDLYNKQNGQCAYSGIPMVFERWGSGRKRYSLSIDQIIPGRGYIIGNIALCCWIVNAGKSDLLLDDYIKICNNVVEHANKTNDIKKEWEFRYNDFSGYLNALRKRVKKEISVPNFNFEEFLGNPKSINKIKKNVDMLMLYIARKDKEVYEFSRYAPQMTFLMNDYKTLRKHILSYNNIAIEDMEKVKKMQNSQIIDSIFLQNICDRISPDLEIEIGAKLKEYVYKIKHPDDKQTIPELLSMITDILQKRYEKNQDAMKIIEYQISEALKNGYLKLGKCESKKARDIIDHIIKNPDSKVHFCGYKREEIRHILPKKFTEVFMAKKRPDFLPVNDNIGIYF